MHDEAVLLNLTKVRRAILICKRCELSSRAGVSPVPWRGEVPSRISIVGEAPGYDENVEGKPFVGASGRLVSGLLEDNGIDLEEIVWMNAASCFPDGPPSLESQKACRPHLRNQLALADSRWILVLGATALRFFEPDERISDVRGTLRQQGETFLYFSFHPAAALRDPERHKLFEEDIRKFSRLVLADDWRREAG